MTLSVTEAIASIEAGPRGPQVAAYFDLDGTLVAGYTGNSFFTDGAGGKGMAIAGLIVGYLITLLGALFIVLAIADSNNY